jgi:hypothetical protein
MPESCIAAWTIAAPLVSPITVSTTSAWTSSVAHPSAPLGSPRVSQGTRSMGRPPMPARCSLMYSATASAVRSCIVLSSAGVRPSLTTPTLIGSPAAGSLGPSSSALSPSLPAPPGSAPESSSLLPHAASSTATAPSRAAPRRSIVSPMLSPHLARLRGPVQGDHTVYI